jgi:hypothetical protein
MSSTPLQSASEGGPLFSRVEAEEAAKCPPNAEAPRVRPPFLRPPAAAAAPNKSVSAPLLRLPLHNPSAASRAPTRAKERERERETQTERANLSISLE